MTETQKTAIPFGPFEANSSDPTLPIPRNLGTPDPTLEAEARCSDSMSPKETAAPIPANMSERLPADHPPQLLHDQEPAPGPQQEQRSPRSQASSPLLFLPRLLRSHDQAPMQVSLDVPFPAAGLEDFSVATETRSRPLDPALAAQDLHRYQPYRAPGVRTGSGFHRQAQAGSTSAPDREVVHRTGLSHMRIDQGQRPPWDQEEPQTILSALDMAWASGGKTTVPLVNRPSRSMHHPSVAPPEVASGDSQQSMREMGRMEPANLDRSREDSVSWSSVGQTMEDPGVLNPHLNPQGMGEFYSRPSGIGIGTFTPQVVDQGRAAPGSSSVELQDSPLGIESIALRERALSYSHELRMQQEEQLRRIKETARVQQLSTTQTPPPPQSLHHLDLPRHRPQSRPMLLGQQLRDQSDRPAHLARPSSRIDMGMVPGLGMDTMALAAGDMGMGAHTDTVVRLPSQTYRQEPGRGHHYLPEAHHPKAPSHQPVSILGDEQGLPMDRRELGLVDGPYIHSSSNNYALGTLRASMDRVELGFNNPDNGGGMDMGTARGLDDRRFEEHSYYR